MKICLFCPVLCWFELIDHSKTILGYTPMMQIITLISFQMWEGETGRLKYQYNNSAAGVTAICFVNNRYVAKSSS